MKVYVPTSMDLHIENEDTEMNDTNNENDEIIKGRCCICGTMIPLHKNKDSDHSQTVRRME